MHIQVCYFPPGTSKWNKIGHKLFSFISMNWRGRPLTSLQVVVNLIGTTKSKTGLKVKTSLDENIYEKKIKITDEEFEKINVQKDNFHGDWNYVISFRFASRQTPLPFANTPFQLGVYKNSLLSKMGYI
jgi:hypothetical protein